MKYTMRRSALSSATKPIPNSRLAAVPIRAQNAICVNPSPLSPRTFPAINSVDDTEETSTSTIRLDFSSIMLRTRSWPEVTMSMKSIIRKTYAVMYTFKNPDSSVSPALESFTILTSRLAFRSFRTDGSIPLARARCSAMMDFNVSSKRAAMSRSPTAFERYSTTVSGAP